MAHGCASLFLTRQMIKLKREGETRREALVGVLIDRRLPMIAGRYDMEANAGYTFNVLITMEFRSVVSSDDFKGASYGIDESKHASPQDLLEPVLELLHGKVGGLGFGQR